MPAPNPNCHVIAIAIAITITIATAVAVSGLSGCKDVHDANATANVSPNETARSGEKNCAELSGFERALCSDPELRELDADLNKMVNRLVARSRHEHQADIRARQADWLADREACSDLARPKRRACIGAVYLDRMQAVQRQIRALPD